MLVIGDRLYTRRELVRNTLGSTCTVAFFSLSCTLTGYFWSFLKQKFDLLKSLENLRETYQRQPHTLSIEAFWQIAANDPQIDAEIKKLCKHFKLSTEELFAKVGIPPKCACNHTNPTTAKRAYTIIGRTITWFLNPATALPQLCIGVTMVSEIWRQSGSNVHRLVTPTTRQLRATNPQQGVAIRRSPARKLADRQHLHPPPRT